MHIIPLRSLAKGIKKEAVAASEDVYTLFLLFIVSTGQTG
jgi:hypothetical protein